MKRITLTLLLQLMLAGLAVTAFAEADGPDFFAVTDVAADDVLNIRAGPSAGTDKIGEIPHDGHAVQNLGCQGLPSFAEWQQMSAQARRAARRDHWCRVRYEGVEGWVAGRFLREDDGGSR